MSKKEIKISNEEMMELMGLKRTSDSNDDSDKTAIELATEKYSKEELAAKETVLSVEPKPDEITPEDTEELTKVANSEEQSPAPTIQRRVMEKPCDFDPFGQTGLSPFGYNMIDPLKSWCWGSILFYPFKISRFS